MPDPRPRRWWTVLAAIAGGAALYLAFPDHDIWPLAVLGLALLHLALRRDGARWAWLVTFCFSLAYLAPLLWWAWVSIGTLPWAALSVVESAILGLFGVAWTGLRRLAPVLRRRPLAGAVVFAGLWVAVEELRSIWPFGGFPWGKVAFSQASGPLARLAWVGGVPLIAFAAALAGACLAVAWTRLRAPRAPSGAWETSEPSTVARWRGAAWALGVALVLVAAPAAIPLATGAQAGELAVGAVQGNVPDRDAGAENRMRNVLANHVRGTLELAETVGAGTLDLVAWPENSTDIDPLTDAAAAASIDAAARAAGAPVLVGAMVYLPDGTRRNTTMLWEPGHGVVATYAKQHPAPFAEYIPIREVVALFTDKVNLVTHEMVPGDRVGVVDLDARRLGRTVPLGVVICFEVAYDSLIDDAVQTGAQILIVQTNNASFGMSSEGAQQFAMSRIRAIEQGRATIQISTVGISGVIAPDGAVEQSGGLFTAEQFHASVPLRTSLTPAAHTAGVLSAVALAGGAIALAAALVAPWWLRRRARRGAEATHAVGPGGPTPHGDRQPEGGPDPDLKTDPEGSEPARPGAPGPSRGPEPGAGEAHSAPAATPMQDTPSREDPSQTEPDSGRTIDA